MRKGIKGMKTYKFRVWGKQQEKWIDDFCYQDQDMWCDYFFGDRIRYFESYYILSQFTGFHDKLAEQIYEGDILEVAGGSRITVESLEAFLIYCGRYEEKHGVPLFPSVQVVGNIYEEKLCP